MAHRLAVAWAPCTNTHDVEVMQSRVLVFDIVSFVHFSIASTIEQELNRSKEKQD